MNRYGVKELFRSIQGEGARVGQQVVFVRFSGCNLWSGNPLQREEGKAMCALWCDTDFRKGIVLDTDDVLGMMQEQWPVEPGSVERWCVLSGGEPCLQLDEELLKALRSQKWKVAIETNGTVANELVQHLDHVCISPKLGSDWTTLCGNPLEGGWAPDEVKVVLPGTPPMVKGWTNEQLEELEQWAMALHREARYPSAMRAVGPALYVQPQDPVLPGPEWASFLHGRYEEEEHEMLEGMYRQNVKRCLQFISTHPQWRLSAQMHKWIELP